MHKEIERTALRIAQAMEKNRKSYLEAEESYRDTGYDRYWNKMQLLDAEYEELKLFCIRRKRLKYDQIRSESWPNCRKRSKT